MATASQNATTTSICVNPVLPDVRELLVSIRQWEWFGHQVSIAPNTGELGGYVRDPRWPMMLEWLESAGAAKVSNFFFKSGLFLC
jgi:hypothetical protein